MPCRGAGALEVGTRILCLCELELLDPAVHTNIDLIPACKYTRAPEVVSTAGRLYCTIQVSPGLPSVRAQDGPGLNCCPASCLFWILFLASLSLRRLARTLRFGTFQCPNCAWGLSSRPPSRRTRTGHRLRPHVATERPSCPQRRLCPRLEAAAQCTPPRLALRRLPRCSSAERAAPASPLSGLA